MQYTVAHERSLDPIKRVWCIVFFITALILFSILMSLVILIYYTNSTGNIPRVTASTVEKTTRYIKITPIHDGEQKTAIIFLHGGAFIGGTSLAAIKLLKYYQSQTHATFYSLKYPLRTSAKNVLCWLLTTLESLPHNKFILIGSSAGAFWALYILCFYYSSKFRNIVNVSVLITKHIVGFISLGGMLNAEVPQEIGSWRVHTDRFIKNATHANVLNPIQYLEDLDCVPFLLIDSTQQVLSFAEQVRDIKAQRNSRGAITQVYIFSKLPHTFMYNWKYPEAYQSANIICQFINTYSQQEVVQTSIKVLPVDIEGELSNILCTNSTTPIQFGQYTLCNELARSIK